MNNQMTTREAFVNPVALQQIEGLANKLIQSKALPSTIQNAGQLMMVLLKGYESGMDAMESIDSYYFVNGKLTIWGDATLRQLRRAGYMVKWPESNNMVAHVEIWTGDGKMKIGEDTFTIEDATLAGLASKSVWKNYPKDQLRWKALSRAIRFHCPEVLGGTYITEAIQDDITPETPPEFATITADQVATIIKTAIAGGGTEEKVREWIKGKFLCDLEQLTTKNYGNVIEVLDKKAAAASTPASEPTDGGIVDAEFTEKTAEAQTSGEPSFEEKAAILAAEVAAQSEAEAEAEAAGQHEANQPQ